MKFPTEYQPEILCPKKGTYSMVELVRTQDGCYLCATDTHALVWLPVTDAGEDTPGPIPVDALKAARKLARTKRLAEAELVCRPDSIRLSDGTLLLRPKRGEGETFPDVTAILPPEPNHRPLNELLLWGRPSSGPYTLRVSVNTHLLARAVEAAGEDGLVMVDITIDVPSKTPQDCTVTAPIAVRTALGGLALVMPGRLR